MNKGILIIVIVLIMIVGGYLLLRGGYQAPAPAPTAPAPEEVTPPSEEVTIPEEEVVTPPVVKEFTVSGTEFSFSPASITVSAGDQVKITFRNDGGIYHNLVVEGLGIATRTIGSGQTDTVDFTTPASGTYTFFCSVPGHRAAGMEGSLRVE